MVGDSPQSADTDESLNTTDRQATRESLSRHSFLVLHSIACHVALSSSLPPRAIAAPIPKTRNTCSRVHIWPGQVWLQFKNLHVGPIPLLDKEILLTGGLICMSLPRMPTRLTDVSQTRGEERGGEKVRLWKQTERFVYMLLEILLPLFCIKKQNVIQSYEFLPSSQRKIITLFAGNLNKWKPESYPPGDVLFIYAEQNEPVTGSHPVVSTFTVELSFLRGEGS